MHRHLAALSLAVAAGAAALPASAFDQGLADPALTVSVPQLPQVVPGLRVEIQATPSAGAASAGTRGCAGAFLRELVRRPGMPDRDAIYRAPLDAGTFLVLYILGEGAAGQLHAHLLAAVGDTHCVDAHFSRALRGGEDVDDWRRGFAGASVKPAPR